MNPVFKISEMTPEQAGAVATMNRQLSSIPPDGKSTAPQFFIDHCLGENRVATCWVIEKDNEPIGFAITCDWVSFGGGFKACKIDLLFVKESHRQHGAAAALLTHIITAARQSGCVRVDIETMPDNEAARTLYDRLGFSARSPSLRFNLYLS